LGDGSVTSVELDGSIDAAFFYDKALTLAEVNALYNTDSGVDYPSLTDLNGTEFAIGQALDGSTDSLDISAVITPLLSTTTGYWEAIVNLDSVASGRFFSLSDTNVDTSITLWIISGGRIGSVAQILGVNSWVLSTDASVLTVGVPTKIAIKHNGTQPTLYIDDVEVAQTFTTDTNKTIWINDMSGLDNFKFGTLDYNGGGDIQFLDGSVQNVKIWSDDTQTTLVANWLMNDVEGANQTDSENSYDATLIGTPVSTLASVNNTTIATIESSLVDWWRLNETSGDRIGELGHTLTDNATVGYALGKVQEVSVNATNVADFVSASSEYLSTTDTSFDKGDEDFSFGGWVKFDATGSVENVIAKWGNSSSKRSYLLQKNGSENLTFFISDDGTANISISSSPITSTNWNFICCVYDSVNDIQKISINGGSFDTVANSTGAYVDGAPHEFQFGSVESGGYINGQVDTSFFYDKALTFAEVQALYNTSHLQYSELPDLVGNTYAVGQVLDGSTDAFNIDAALTPLAATTEGAWECIVNPTTFVNTYLISFGDTDADELIGMYMQTAGKIGFFCRVAGVNQFSYLTDSVVLTAGVSAKVKVVQNGTVATIYVDDVEEASTDSVATDSGAFFSDATGLDNGRIGMLSKNSTLSGYVDGSIQNVKIWSDAAQTTLVANYAMNNVEGALQLNSEEASVDNAMVLDGTADALNADVLITPLAATTTGEIEFYVTPTNLTGTQYYITFAEATSQERIQIRMEASGKINAQLVDGGVTQWSVITDSIVLTAGLSTKINIVHTGITPIIKIEDVAVASTFVVSIAKSKWFNDIPLIDNGRIGCRNITGSNVEFAAVSIQDIKIWSDDTQTTLVANYECDVLGLDSENGYNATAIGNPTLHSLNTNATPIGTPVSGLASVVSDTITDMTTDMVAYWNLDETSGDRYDYHNPTVDNAILLDGSTDALDIDVVLTPLASTTTGEIELYYTPIDATPTSNEFILTFADASANTFISIQNRTDGVCGVVIVDATVAKTILKTDAAAFSDGVQTKINVIQDGVALIIKIDDVEVAQTETGGSSVYWFNDIPLLDNGRIGCLNQNSGGNSNFTNGTIQNVKIWSDDTQTTLVAHYKMDETDGSRFDSSGNDYTATEIGTPDYVSLTTMLKDNNTVGSATFNRLGLVHNWIDQSTNAYVFSQDTIADMPLLQENSIEFDGTDDILDYTVADVYGGDSSGIIFFSGYYDNTTFNVILATGDTATTNYYLWLGVLGSGELFVSCKDGTTTDTVKSTNTIVNGAYYYGYIKSTGTAYEINLNGTDEVLITTAGTNRGHFFADILNRDNITIGSMLRSSGNYGSTQPNKIIYSNDHTINTAPILKFMSNPDN
jgi:hypothetical protein